MGFVSNGISKKFLQMITHSERHGYFPSLSVQIGGWRAMFTAILKVQMVGPTRRFLLASMVLVIPLLCADAQKSHTDVIRRIVNDPNLQPPDHGKPFGSWDPEYPPPTGAASVFQLRQDYPVRYDDHEHFPWQSVDFEQEPMEYLRVVLKYCLDGMEEVHFVPQENKVHSWYHAPWQHDDSQPAEWTEVRWKTIPSAGREGIPSRLDKGKRCRPRWASSQAS